MSAPAKILLAEDHLEMAELLCMILQGMGHDVEVVESVTSALRALEYGRHDPLISDYRLSDGTALELMQTARALGATIPGICLSGYGDEVLELCLQAGFSLLLTKPTEEHELQAAIAKLVP